MNKKEINLLFIVFHGIDKAGGGIGKKINSQVGAFQNLGIKTSLSFLEVNDDNQYIGRKVNGETIEQFKKNFGKYIQWKWRYKFKKLIRYIENQKINVVYIRYSHFANPYFIYFLKRLKKKEIRILMEIPSYPYDIEYNKVGISLKIVKRIEEFYRRYFYKYVDRMVTFSTFSKILGVDTIKINNGVNINSIPLKNNIKKDTNIHLIAVAVMNVWHGYDRLIEGLRLYYDNNPETKVYFHVVGDGEDNESMNYKSLVKKYRLNDYVLFYGFKTGEDLNKLFDYADFAVGSIGIHRIGLTHTNPIKFSEYTARGIPFLYSGIYDIFENQPFIYKVTNDDSPVDIVQLLSFIQKIEFTPGEIRKFAERHLTWEIQMNKVIEEVLLLQ